MMIINSKNALVLAILFLVPFVVLSQEPVITEASKGKYANKIVVEWTGETAVLYRLYSKSRVENVKTLNFRDPYPTERSAKKIVDIDVEYGYYYYKMGKSINYGYIAKVADNEPKTPIDTIKTIKQLLLKGEVEIAKALNGNTKSVKLTIDKTTIELVNAIGGSIKIERSEKEKGKEIFSKPIIVQLKTSSKILFFDKKLNDSVRAYRYQIIVLDKDLKEVGKSNIIEVEIPK